MSDNIITLPYDIGEAMKSEGMPALGILPNGYYLLRVDEVKNYTAKNKDKESVLCALTISDMQSGLPGRDDTIGRKYLHFFQKSEKSNMFLVRFALACGVKGLSGKQFDGALFANKMVIGKVEENNRDDGTVGSQINTWEPAGAWKRYGAVQASNPIAAAVSAVVNPAKSEPASSAPEVMEIDFPF